VFYQVFPDRFANGDPSNDPPNVRPWESPPQAWGWHGGDLRGIRQRLDYLQDLGVAAIYSNPIFEAPSNHRYNTSDYFRIDRWLGDNAEFDALLAEVHRRGMRLVLDGVFNHSGRGFFAFQDLLENAEHAAHRDWYHVRRFPLDAYGPGPALNYVGWWNLKGLPKFNTAHRPVREYLLRVARHWIERGVDGWRLDVPNEIDDDGFWAEFRATVKGANPDAYLVGEIWEADSRWVGDAHFDGLMLYPLRKLLLSFLAEASISPTEFLAGLTRLTSPFPAEFQASQLLLLGSHDTERIRTALQGRAEAVRLAALILFTLPGAPCIYYGDEIGLEGESDPACRAAFPWREEAWDRDTRDHFQRLVRLRKSVAGLRETGIRPILAEDSDGVLAFERGEGEHAAVVVVNRADAEGEVRLPAVGLLARPVSDLTDVWGGAQLAPSDGGLTLRLPPHGGAVISSSG
jgi:glycosidase